MTLAVMERTSSPASPPRGEMARLTRISWDRGRVITHKLLRAKKGAAALSDFISDLA